MITTLIASILLTQAAPATLCPMTGEASKSTGEVIDYAGTRYTTCCPGCGDTFQKSIDATIAADVKKGWLIGEFLFDPVSGLRVTKPAAHMDYKGNRYNFSSAENLAKFKAAPTKYAVTQKKESLTCPVSGEAIGSYSAAAAYVDFKDVRYYICCPDCFGAFKKDPSKFTAKVADKVEKPGVHNAGASDHKPH